MVNKNNKTNKQETKLDNSTLFTNIVKLQSNSSPAPRKGVIEKNVNEFGNDIIRIMWDENKIALPEELEKVINEIANQGYNQGYNQGFNQCSLSKEKEMFDDEIRFLEELQTGNEFTLDRRLNERLQKLKGAEK